MSLRREQLLSVRRQSQFLQSLLEVYGFESLGLTIVHRNLIRFAGELFLHWKRSKEGRSVYLYPSFLLLLREHALTIGKLLRQIVLQVPLK